MFITNSPFGVLGLNPKPIYWWGSRLIWCTYCTHNALLSLESSYKDVLHCLKVFLNTTISLGYYGLSYPVKISRWTHGNCLRCWCLKMHLNKESDLYNKIQKRKWIFEGKIHGIPSFLWISIWRIVSIATWKSH